jgi:hypothetical protein
MFHNMAASVNSFAGRIMESARAEKDAILSTDKSIIATLGKVE